MACPKETYLVMISMQIEKGSSLAPLNLMLKSLFPSLDLDGDFPCTVGEYKKGTDIESETPQSEPDLEDQPKDHIKFASIYT